MSRVPANQTSQAASPLVDSAAKSGSAPLLADAPTVLNVDCNSLVNDDTRIWPRDLNGLPPQPFETVEIAEQVQAAPTEPSQDVVSTQTHSRHDPITGRWTIFAAGRDQRPNDFVDRPPAENASFICPFCSGNEGQTPPAILEWNAADFDTDCSDGLADSVIDAPTPAAWSKRPWSIRVIPNKFPAVTGPEHLVHEPVNSYSPQRRENHHNTLFRSRPIAGGHEVFIESPSHDQSIETLDLSQATMLFHAYQLRMRHWREIPTIRYVSLFKNSGSAAGASLHHSHSQLIATSEMPMAAKAVAERMKLHWAKTGCCLQCDTIRGETKFKERVVAATKSLVAYCPFGSHLPMLLRISTKRHLDCFEYLTMGELQELARLVRSGVRWLQTLYPDVSYNFLIHTRPPGVIGEERAHWSLEIFPRITQVAGFEWSSDCMINPMLPEVAAAKYRELARGENPFR